MCFTVLWGSLKRLFIVAAETGNASKCFVMLRRDVTAKRKLFEYAKMYLFQQILIRVYIDFI